MKTSKTSNETRLGERTKHLLEEIRIVLPGTQALLGFQLVSVFSNGFDKLSMDLKDIHLLSLSLVTLTTILLIAPAAYDRIKDEDKNTEHFIQFSSKLLLIALISLSLAISGNLYVVTHAITDSQNLATTFSLTALIISIALWFGYSLYRRKTD